MTARTIGRLYIVEKHGIAYLLNHDVKENSSISSGDVIAANISPVDARRLAACWNLSAAFTTEQIEAGECDLAKMQDECDKLRADLAKALDNNEGLAGHALAKEMGLVEARADLTEGRALLAEVLATSARTSVNVELTERIRALLKGGAA